MRHFDFWENWGEFPANALTPGRVWQAQEDFTGLIVRSATDISRRSFLDIGFGQGLSLLRAASAGAEAVGCDINPKCAPVLEYNRIQFPEVNARALTGRKLVERGFSWDTSAVNTCRC